MKGFLTLRSLPLRQVLLVESSSREVGESLIQALREIESLERLDVLTCYPSAPSPPGHLLSQAFSVHQPEAVQNRCAFLNDLAHGPYDGVVLICSGSGVLAKWKWALAAKTKARVVLADETGHWFTLDIAHLPPLALLLVRRSNIASLPHALWKLISFLLAPFTVLYLILYTLATHLARVWRIRRTRAS